MSEGPPKRQTPLSQEAVVDASIRIAHVRGIDGVTMRAVAAELGVTPMALYYHVRNKDELVGLIAREVMRSVVPLTVADEGWEGSLRQHLLSTWETLAQYPGLAAYMINLPTLGTTADGYRAGTTFFEGAGFSPRAAGFAWSFALTFIHGRLSVDSRLDRAAARSSSLDSISARDHVAFGVEAVIMALRQILDDPSIVDELTSAPLP